MSKTEDKAFTGCFGAFVLLLLAVMVIAVFIGNQR